MARGDGTGPMGLGPMTGRSAGYCAGYSVPGYMNPVFGRGRGFGYGRGWNRGRGWGRGFGWFTPGLGYEQKWTAKDEKAALEEEEKILREELAQIQEEKKALKDQK